MSKLFIFFIKWEVHYLLKVLRLFQVLAYEYPTYETLNIWGGAEMFLSRFCLSPRPSKSIFHWPNKNFFSFYFFGSVKESWCTTCGIAFIFKSLFFVSNKIFVLLNTLYISWKLSFVMLICFLIPPPVTFHRLL